jgi:hypothetical protein
MPQSCQLETNIAASAVLLRLVMLTILIAAALSSKAACSLVHYAEQKDDNALFEAKNATFRALCI